MSHKRILIIEDDQAIREALVDLFESEGYQVERAVNGQEGIERLTSAQSLPCVILLDLMMPIKDGFAFRKEQLENPKLSNVPVVVMSADGHVHEKKQRLQAKDYLHKPVDIDVYLDVVKRYCG